MVVVGVTAWVIVYHFLWRTIVCDLNWANASFEGVAGRGVPHWILVVVQVFTQVEVVMQRVVPRVPDFLRSLIGRRGTSLAPGRLRGCGVCLRVLLHVIHVVRVVQGVYNNPVVWANGCTTSRMISGTRGTEPLRFPFWPGQTGVPRSGVRSLNPRGVLPLGAPVYRSLASEELSVVPVWPVVGGSRRLRAGDVREATGSRQGARVRPRSKRLLAGLDRSWLTLVAPWIEHPMAIES